MKQIKRNYGFTSACLAAWLFILCACQAGNPTPGAQQTLRVFCAGSLIVPFAGLEAAFEAANPGVDVQNECHGSIQVIRHVTELHEAIDIVASADHALIPMLMYAASSPDTGLPYASWYIRFAGNRMALAYTPQSRYSSEIDAKNWYEVLARQDTRLGLADPRFDAAGYRALMVISMAEKEYGVKGLYDALVRDAFTLPLPRFREEGWTEITVPEVFEPAGGSNIVLRGGSIQLLALLETGDLDYAFEYESVIAQHKLLNIPLPDSINLGALIDADKRDLVQVKLDFQRFASVKPVFNNEPIGYGITIPSNAPQPELAARFIAFLLSEQGQVVMEAANHPLLDPIQCDQPSRVPSLLKPFCQAGQ